MANFFSSLAKGLSGGNKGTSYSPYVSAPKPASPKQSFVSNYASRVGQSSSTVGPYRNVVPKSFAPATMPKPQTSPFRAQAASAGTGFAALRALSNSSSLTPSNANRVKERAGTPYIPATRSGGGKSLAPNASTIAARGPGYLPPSSGTYSSTVPTKSFVGARTASAASPREQFIASATATPTDTFDVGSEPFVTDTSATDPTPTDTSSSSGSSSSGSSGAAFGGTSSSYGTSPSSYRSKYLTMLDSLYDPNRFKSSMESLDELEERMAREKLRARDKEEEVRKNEQGQGIRTFNNDLSENQRLSTKELADLAIAASPYETYIKNATDALKAAADYETDGNESFTLGEGQTRYAYDPATGNYKQVGSVPKSASSEAEYFNLGAGESRYAYDPKTGTVRAIATGPRTEQEEKEARRTEGYIQSATGVLGNIDAALTKIGPMTSGLIGAGLRQIPGTPAYNLDRLVDTVKANIGFQALQAMREASPTGGALGQVAVQELNMLQATISSLDTAQSPSQLRAALEKVRQHYENWLATLQQSGGSRGGDSSVFADQW